MYYLQSQSFVVVKDANDDYRTIRGGYSFAHLFDTKEEAEQQLEGAQVAIYNNFASLEKLQVKEV